jgi:LemA protein
VEGPILVAVAIVVVIVVVLLLVFNRFVRLRNMVDESWHDVGTELQRRYDLIPNLVNTVKGYAAHEQEVFTSVTSLRLDAMATPRAPDAQAPREEALGRGVSQLMAVAENYPDLKASEQFLSLQHELTDTEDRIQVARRIYNANVRSYDTLVQSFPALIIARSFDFQLRPYFEVEAVVRDAGPPSVDLSGQT